MATRITNTVAPLGECVSVDVLCCLSSSSSSYSAVIQTERDSTKKGQAFVSVIYKGHKSGKYLLKASRLRKDVHFSPAG